MNMLGHLDGLIDSGITNLKIEGRAKGAYYIAAMTNAYKTAVNEYIIRRGFEDAGGNVLKPFHGRVVRPGDLDFGQGAEGQVMRSTDAAFAGMAGEGYDRGSNTAVADSVIGSIAAEHDRVTVADAVDSTASGTPVDTAIGPDDMSSHARSMRRESDTAVEQIETGWKHTTVRPIPCVELPEWLLEETNKVTRRDYSIGFYYPEYKVTQNIDRSTYFRSWLVVNEVLSWSADGDGRVTLMSRNKIEPGQQAEFLLPGGRPLVFTVPETGLRDTDGAPVPAINNPAHVFLIPCPHQVPIDAAIRSRIKKPALKAG